MKFKELQEDIHKNAIDHGWWEEERGFGELISLCHSELSEALEEYRNGHPPQETYYKCKCEDPFYECKADEGGTCAGCVYAKPEGIPTELADVVIRIMDMCGRYGIDLETVINEKHEYNKGREYKHGGKKI